MSRNLKTHAMKKTGHFVRVGVTFQHNMKSSNIIMPKIIKRDELPLHAIAEVPWKYT